MPVYTVYVTYEWLHMMIAQLSLCMFVLLGVCMKLRYDTYG